MELDALDGSRAHVESVKPTNRLQATYNFTVADFHTYFAGEQKALVHNCTQCGQIATSFIDVAAHIRQYASLPSNYITKAQAKALGWENKLGNLATVAPGKSIGGDIFQNKEQLLPGSNGRIWYEADINYTSGFRGTDRILYSNDGLIYRTSDNYKSWSNKCLSTSSIFLMHTA